MDEQKDKIETRIKEILNNIRAVREKVGMAREKLAIKIGCNKDTIALLEKGDRRLSLEWIIRISDGLDCTISQLLGDQPFDPLKNTHSERDNSHPPLIIKYMSDAIEIMNKVIDPKEKAKRNEAELLSTIYKKIYDIYEKQYEPNELIEFVEQKKNESFIENAVIKFLEQKIKS